MSMNDGSIYLYLSWILAVQTNKMYFSNLQSMRGHNHHPPRMFNLKKRILPNGYQIVWLTSRYQGRIYFWPHIHKCSWITDKAWFHMRKISPIWHLHHNHCEPPPPGKYIWTTLRLPRKLIFGTEALIIQTR